MKNITFILIFVSAFACKSQEVIPMYNGPVDRPATYYLKDLDNDMTPYEGEWLWQDGTNSITIQLQKIEMFARGNNFVDHLVGEYQYVENGFEIINSLPINYTGDPWSHNITGGTITSMTRDVPECNGCGFNLRYVKMGFKDPVRLGISGQITMVQYNDDGVEKINLRLRNTFNANLEAGYNGPMLMSIPEGDYTFIKQ